MSIGYLQPRKIVSCSPSLNQRVNPDVARKSADSPDDYKLSFLLVDLRRRTMQVQAAGQT